MAPTRVQSFQDGPRLTVNTLVKSPTLIPKRIVSMADQAFIVDRVLRNAGSSPGGAVIYNESTPLFADGNPEVVEEFGEIPVVNTSTGKQMVARTVKRAMALMVSKEMINRNAVDQVNSQITMIKNAFVRTMEDVFLDAFLTNASIPTLAASAAWGAAAAAATNVYTDVAHAVYNIQNADADSANGTGSNKFNFNPNTIVINDKVLTLLLTDANVTKVLQVGDAATRQPLVAGTGSVGNVVFGAFGLKVVPSWRISPDKVIILESHTVGGISDEVPFGATPLYEIKPRETWRTDVTRTSAVFIDQPKAALILTGVNGGSSSIANFT